MYPNLRAEMARHKITLTQLADVLGVRAATMSAKNNGQSPFSLDECFAIKKALNTDLSLEELFEKEEI